MKSYLFVYPYDQEYSKEYFKDDRGYAVMIPAKRAREAYTCFLRKVSKERRSEAKTCKPIPVDMYDFTTPEYFVIW